MASENGVLVMPGGGTLYLFGAVRGLVEEEERLTAEAEAFGPDVMAIAVSRRELEGLMASLDGLDEDHMTNYDEIYSRHLSRFGEVAMPPPDLMAACRFAVEHDIPLRSVDLSDLAMYEASIRFITPFETVRYGILMRNMIGRKFKADNARDFAIEWDSRVRSVRGFRKLEEYREGVIARRLRGLSFRYGRSFAVLETQRVEGIAKDLERLTRASRS